MIRFSRPCRVFDKMDESALELQMGKKMKHACEEMRYVDYDVKTRSMLTPLDAVCSKDSMILLEDGDVLDHSWCQPGFTPSAMCALLHRLEQLEGIVSSQGGELVQLQEVVKTQQNTIVELR